MPFQIQNSILYRNRLTRDQISLSDEFFGAFVDEVALLVFVGGVFGGKVGEVRAFEDFPVSGFHPDRFEARLICESKE